MFKQYTVLNKDAKTSSSKVSENTTLEASGSPAPASTREASITVSTSHSELAPYPKGYSLVSIVSSDGRESLFITKQRIAVFKPKIKKSS